jgi:flagellar basal-body rod modification protein FlgD
MAGVTATSSTSNSSDSSGLTADAINDVDISSFLKLMITELQNQDPLNPMDNKDMLAQLSQIRSIGATDKLTKTLDSVLLGQSLSSATNMMGTNVAGVTDDGESFNGWVTRVAFDQGVAKLHVENLPGPSANSAEGNIDAGTYAYRVVWEAEDGKLLGMEFSGDEAITTTGEAGVDRAILLHDLPVTAGPKYIYRTDASGKGTYQLTDVIRDGQRGSFLDVTNDSDLNGSEQTASFQHVATASRAYDVKLENIASIRPPSF